MRKVMKKMAILAAAVVAAFSALFTPMLTSKVSAQESGAVSVSGVMSDLKKDATFSAEDYPEKSLIELRLAGEEYLQLIKIAESVNDELYLYVYQPSDSTTELTATMVNMGQTTTESDARLYPLRLVSTEGVFDKYLVEGLEVLDFEVRNYTIVSLYRAWQKGVDAKTGNDNTESSVAHAVGQTWYARNTESGDVEYAYTYEDVITITSEWHGEIDYQGINFGNLDAYTTSHFIVFTTDHIIEELIEAVVVYSMEDVNQQWCKVGNQYCFLKEEVESLGRYRVILNRRDKGTANGYIGPFLYDEKYSWNRISTAEEFLKAETLTSEAKSMIESVQSSSNGSGTFVLRYAESEWAMAEGKETDIGSHWMHDQGWKMSTRAYDAAIIQMTFERNGVTYTLGVVDSMTTSDGVGDNKTSDDKNLWEKIEQLIQAIGIIIGAIALGFIIYFVVLLVSKLVRFIRANPIRFGGGGNAGRGDGSGGN